MGRWFGTRGRKPEQQVAVAAAVQQSGSSDWYDDVIVTARAEGSMPYLVEGYPEINEAVRRGHAVLLRREPCDVTDTVRIFDTRPDNDPDAVVTVLRFNVRTARYVISDPASTVGSLELTSKRLERYLADPRRSVGIALGA